MESSRTYTQSIKSKLILNKSFVITKDLNVGDEGQILVRGIIETEKLEDFDGVENLIKVVYINEAEFISKKISQNDNPITRI